MWIIPKNYNILAYAPATVESKEELSLLGNHLEQSLMWRSKPTQLPTWSRRWSRVPWLRALFGRTLKPSHWTHFEEWLTSSLGAIPANPSALQENDSARKTPDTSGHGYVESSTALCPDCVSLRTSKGTSPTDCDKCSLIWKQEVTRRRGDYSVRQKWVRHIRENGCLLWPTPTARDCRDDGDMRCTQQRDSPNISAMARRFPTGEECQVKIGKIHDLNPGWVEQMMGIPTKWTDLGSWGMESCPKQPPELG